MTDQGGTSWRALVGGAFSRAATNSRFSYIIELLETLRDLLDDVRYGIMPVTEKSANYTATNTDFAILVSASTVDITITLPAASNGKCFHIKKIDATAYSVIIDGDGAETIDGAATQTLTAQHESLTIIARSGAWYIL